MLCFRASILLGLQKVGA